MLFKKIISISLMFAISFNTVFVQAQEKDAEIKTIFEPIIDIENIEGYKLRSIYYPINNLPSVIPPGFFTLPYLDDLYCLKGVKYGEVVTKLSMKQKDINRIVESERTNCKIELERQKNQYEERERALEKQISELKKTNDSWDLKYKSLERKNFWTQVISGAAVLTISGLSIYYVSK